MPLRLDPTFRDALAAADRPLAGIWVASGSPVVAEICAGSGLDWLLIDMEHSPNDLEAVLAQLQAVAGYPITPVVRVPIGDPVIIKRVLDLGAQNILVPMVSSAAEAEEAVRAVRYPPRGIRGSGAALGRSARWNRLAGYVTEADAHVSLTVQIETADAVAAAGEIASVDGVDAVFVGPSDLSASMGHLGKQAHPEVQDAVRRTIDAVRATGTPVGVNAFAPDAARAYAEAGAAFLGVSADVTLLVKGSDALSAAWIPSAPRVGAPAPYRPPPLPE